MYTCIMKKARCLIGFFGCITTLCSSACSLVTRPYDENYPVEISNEAYTEYYRQFQSRFLFWETSWRLPIYEIPAVNGLFSQYNFYEFQPTSNSTCYFREPKSIYIGNDKWESGCVPHEIGHAVLYTIGHPCWREFEHEDGKKKCLNNFQSREDIVIILGFVLK